MIKPVTGRAVHRCQCWHWWWWQWQHTTDRAWLHRLITKWAKNLDPTIHCIAYSCCTFLNYNSHNRQVCYVLKFDMTWSTSDWHVQHYGPVSCFCVSISQIHQVLIHELFITVILICSNRPWGNPVSSGCSKSMLTSVSHTQWLLTVQWHLQSERYEYIA